MDSELVKGADGIFDVVVDDEVIFSKHREKRFPETTEILGRLRTRS